MSDDFRLSSDEEPSDALNDSILAASRRELKTGPGYAFSPFASDWHVPASLAAVLVLSVSVFVSIQEDHDSSYLGAPAVEQHETLEESMQAASAPVDTSPARQLAGARKESEVALSAPASTKPATIDAELMMDSLDDSPGDKAVEFKQQNSTRYKRRQEAEIMNMPTRIHRELDDYSSAIAPAAKMKSPGLGAKPGAGKPELQKKEGLELSREIPEEYAPLAPDTSLRSAQDSEDLMEARQFESATEMAFDDPSQALQWLRQIQLFWEQGEHEKAGQELRRFHESYPDFEIEQYLDRELLKNLSGYLAP